MDNVDMIRAIYRAWDKPGGFAGSRSLDFFNEDIEYVNPEGAIEPGTRWGHDGMRQVAEALDGAFSEYSHELLDLIASGDKVIALTTFKARGRDSGAQVEIPEQHVWTIRDGKVTRFEWFHDERRARKAAGVD